MWICKAPLRNAHVKTAGVTFSCINETRLQNIMQESRSLVVHLCTGHDVDHTSPCPWIPAPSSKDLSITSKRCWIFSISQFSTGGHTCSYVFSLCNNTVKNILIATHVGMFTYFEKVFIKKKSNELTNPVGFRFWAEVIVMMVVVVMCVCTCTYKEGGLGVY